MEAVKDATRQVVNRSGPVYDKWRRNWGASDYGRPETPF